jgi:hypothetical protein
MEAEGRRQETRVPSQTSSGRAQPARPPQIPHLDRSTWQVGAVIDAASAASAGAVSGVTRITPAGAVKNWAIRWTGHVEFSGDAAVLRGGSRGF